MKIFHFIAAIQFLYGLYYECVYVLPEELKLRKFSFGGKLIYLTFLNGIIQVVYHSIAFIHDFVEEANSPTIKRLRDYIFASLAFPLAMDVSVSFWGLYSIDRELVFPRVIDSIYPWWLNQILHTSVFACIGLELLMYHHQYPSRTTGLIGLNTFAAIYIIWLLVVKVIAGAWVYPVLNVLTIPQRCLFLMAVGTVPMIFYFVGEFLNKFIWAKQKLVQEKMQ